MNLSNYSAQKGFTIVELLIVVIVIAILATITIVSYNNITGRANVAAANAAVSTFQKKAELFSVEPVAGLYPTGSSDLSDTTKSYYLPSTAYAYVTTSGTVTVTKDTGKYLVNVRKCAPSATSQALITSANISGLEITYWDYNAAGLATKNIGSGACPAAA